MANVLRNAVIGCALAGTLVLGAVAPSLAQVVYVDPYGYGAPQATPMFRATPPAGTIRRAMTPAECPTRTGICGDRDPTVPAAIRPCARRTAARTRRQTGPLASEPPPRLTQGRWFTSFAGSH